MAGVARDTHDCCVCWERSVVSKAVFSLLFFGDVRSFEGPVGKRGGEPARRAIERPRVFVLFP